ncbi:MAG: hypothetical protein COB53_02300 [Elusimicrobia bacterium]|nr:MAG: hypothetical protein COB53_02300 [Elusimicrobiota bacterium]
MKRQRVEDLDVENSGQAAAASNIALRERIVSFLLKAYPLCLIGSFGLLYLNGPLKLGLSETVLTSVGVAIIVEMAGFMTLIVKGLFPTSAANGPTT